MTELNLSPETRAELENITLSGMNAYAGLADKVRSSINMMDKVKRYTI